MKANDEPEELVHGIHEAIIIKELFSKVQQKIEQRSRSGKGDRIYKKQEELPLRRFLLCPKCGGRMTGSNPGGNGGRYWYYHCRRKCVKAIRAEVLNKSFEQYLQSIQIPPEITELYQRVLSDVYREKEGNREQQIKSFEKHLAESETRQAKLTMEYVDEKIPKEAYGRAVHELENQIRHWQARLDEIRSIDSNFVTHLKSGLALLPNLATSYRAANIHTKQKIIGSICPENLTWDGEKCRTIRENEVIVQIICKKAKFAVMSNEKGDSPFDESPCVPPRGFEPLSPE